MRHKLIAVGNKFYYFLEPILLPQWQQPSVKSIYMESISCSQSSIWIKVTEFKKLSKSFPHDLSLRPLWQHPDQWHFIP